MSTMTTGINTSAIVIPSSNSVSTGTSTIGLEVSRKPAGGGLIMNGSLSPSSGGGGGIVVGNTYSSCSTTGVGVSVSASCQPIQGQAGGCNSALINSQSVVPVSSTYFDLFSFFRFRVPDRTRIIGCILHLFVIGFWLLLVSYVPQRSECYRRELFH